MKRSCQETVVDCESCGAVARGCSQREQNRQDAFLDKPRGLAPAKAPRRGGGDQKIHCFPVYSVRSVTARTLGKRSGAL